MVLVDNRLLRFQAVFGRFIITGTYFMMANKQGIQFVNRKEEKGYMQFR